MEMEKLVRTICKILLRLLNSYIYRNLIFKSLFKILANKILANKRSSGVNLYSVEMHMNKNNRLINSTAIFTISIDKNIITIILTFNIDNFTIIQLKQLLQKKHSVFITDFENDKLAIR